MYTLDLMDVSSQVNPLLPTTLDNYPPTPRCSRIRTVACLRWARGEVKREPGEPVQRGRTSRRVRQDKRV